MERPAPEPAKPAAPQQAEALAYFISKASGNVFPVFKPDSLIGRYDSVTGQTPEVDLTHEDSARNISRRHARLVVKEGKPFVAEEIGTMNGTYLNGQRLATGVLTPIKDGDELTLCRLGLTFRLPAPVGRRPGPVPVRLSRIASSIGRGSQPSSRRARVESSETSAARGSGPTWSDCRPGVIPELREAEGPGDPQAELVAAEPLGAAQVEAAGPAALEQPHQGVGHGLRVDRRPVLVREEPDGAAGPRAPRARTRSRCRGHRGRGRA